MIPLLLIVALASAVPTYDVEKSCQAASEATQDDSGYKGCLDDEKVAKERVAKEWSNYSATTRQECTANQGDDEGNSYVELMTCFEMQDWKKDLGPLSANGGAVSSSAADAKGSPPLPGQFGGAGSLHPLGGAPGMRIH
jgi:hypothetical protein